MSQSNREPMLEMFIFETNELLGQLEEIIISSEKDNSYSIHNTNEIFRIMHTIKGSSAMMLYNNISSLAHSIEDLFYFIREGKAISINFSELTDLILKSADFIKEELAKIEEGKESNGDPSLLNEEIREFISDLKKTNFISDKQSIAVESVETPYTSDGTFKKLFKAVLYFENDCQMENVRAFNVLHSLKDIANVIQYSPSNIIDDNESEERIRKDGFKILFRTDYPIDMVREILMRSIFLKHLELEELNNGEEAIMTEKRKSIILDEAIPEEHKMTGTVQGAEANTKSLQQSIISVSVARLDKLMDLVGEMVIAEAMVVQNPDLMGLELDNFQKAARQLNKITTELQDVVMSIRMVSLSATFHKMNRIVRDMCKKLNKEVHLDISGEDTEVDKNIIEHISDPLMHLVRNALDHGIESPEKRHAKGKSQAGTITLEAKNAGSDVLIIVKDDGKGLNKEQIIKKAKENGLLYKPEEELSDKEIFNLVLLPGFTTKGDVSEFSGRGVGMDVVTKNIETIGGSVSIFSIQDKGTTITLKLPLTLAIIDGMNIKVGDSHYTIPTMSIRESFRPTEGMAFKDPENNEMIMVRGQCYQVLRLYELFGRSTSVTKLNEGIAVMVEQDGRTICLFADELLGQQQVVVKALPDYITNVYKTNMFSGCTLLGDGSISLIINVSELTEI